MNHFFKKTNKQIFHLNYFLSVSQEVNADWLSPLHLCSHWLRISNMRWHEMKVLGKDFTLYTHTVTASPYRRQYKRTWKICSWTKPCVSKQPSRNRNREPKNDNRFSTRGAFQCANSTWISAPVPPTSWASAQGLAAPARQSGWPQRYSKNQRRRGQGQLLLHLHQHVSERSGPRSACGFSHGNGIKGLMMDAGRALENTKRADEVGVLSGRAEPGGARHAVTGAAIFQTRQPSE